MDKIDELNISGFIASAVSDVYDTMLSMEVEILDSSVAPKIGKNLIIGSVSFSGKVMGSVNVMLDLEYAFRMTSIMLDMNIDEVEDEEASDVVGEITNMIGGDLKSRLCDAGLTCQLSIPTIISGQDFKIQTVGWVKKERIAFRFENYDAIAFVYIKTMDA